METPCAGWYAFGDVARREGSARTGARRRRVRGIGAAVERGRRRAREGIVGVARAHVAAGCAVARRRRGGSRPRGARVGSGATFTVREVDGHGGTSVAFVALRHRANRCARKRPEARQDEGEKR